MSARAGSGGAGGRAGDWARLVPVAALAALMPMACSDGGAARAAELAAPHREEHRRFAAWAERTLASEAGHPRSPAELEETLFAPLFLESDVLAATVTRGETTFTHGSPMPEGLEWEIVREGSERLRVAEGRVGTTPTVILAQARGGYEVVLAFRAAQ